MKKIYNAPEAGLLCFRPVENLASINLGNMQNVGGLTGPGSAANPSDNDIKIPV